MSAAPSFERRPGELTPSELADLVAVARRSVEQAVRDRTIFRPDVSRYPAALAEPLAAFVTLRRDGRLRGCIGTMVGNGPLVATVADRARSAAFEDRRFDPVRPDELADLTVEVSVLTPMERFKVDGYDALVQTLRPHVDGLLVQAGRYRATFLPSVWDELPDPARFVEALWHKAGLPSRAWPAGIETWRYTAQHG